MTDQTLSNLSREERRFEPPAELAANANVKEEVYEQAASDREAFWAEQAERLDWGQKWDRVLDWDNPPFAKWFTGGTINAAYNCVDRHVEAGNGDKVAIHWVGEPEDDTRDLTYAELKDEVCKAANALTELGVEKGDRVAIYLPMIPETVVAMLACARHRCAAHGGLRRVLRRRPREPGGRLPGEGDHHRRRRLPPWRPVGAQAGGRRGGRQGLREGPGRRQGARGPAYRPGRRVGRLPRRVVARRRRQGVGRARSRDARRRAPALRHVHLGHDRQPEGHPAHHRRLPRRYVVHPLGGLRPQAGDRRLLVHRRRRLGHRPLLHGLRAARQRRDAGGLRRHPGQPAQGPLVGDRREVRRHHLLHRPDRDPDVHEVGLGDPREVRPLLDPGARFGR